jgi:hypothetical protein
VSSSRTVRWRRAHRLRLLRFNEHNVHGRTGNRTVCNEPWFGFTTSGLSLSFPKERRLVTQFFFFTFAIPWYVVFL